MKTISIGKIFTEINKAIYPSGNYLVWIIKDSLHLIDFNILRENLSFKLKNYKNQSVLIAFYINRNIFRSIGMKLICELVILRCFNHHCLNSCKNDL